MQRDTVADLLRPGLQMKFEVWDPPKRAAIPDTPWTGKVVVAGDGVNLDIGMGPYDPGDGLYIAVGDPVVLEQIAGSHNKVRMVLHGDGEDSVDRFDALLRDQCSGLPQASALHPDLPV